MTKFWFFVYNIIFLPLIWTGFRLLSLFNSKIREGFKGRKYIFRDIESWNLDSSTKKIIFHSSSLGEFQQAIPIIEELQKKGFEIIATFFSPSGYKNSLNEWLLPSQHPSCQSNQTSFKQLSIYLGTLADNLGCPPLGHGP